MLNFITTQATLASSLALVDKSGMPPSQQEISSFLNPYTAVKEFGLKLGMSFADFGSGSGHFSVAAALEVGPDGLVSAVDIRSTVLEALRGFMALRGIFQVKIIQGNIELERGSKLEDASQDRVLCANILHQSQAPPAILREARRVVKDMGKLIIIEWRFDAPLGPPQRLSMEEAHRLATEAGFVLEDRLDVGAYHYGLILGTKANS